MQSSPNRYAAVRAVGIGVFAAVALHVSAPQEAQAQSPANVETTRKAAQQQDLFALYNAAYYSYLRRDFESARSKFRRVLNIAQPDSAFAKLARQYLSELEDPVPLERMAEKKQAPTAERRVVEVRAPEPLSQASRSNESVNTTSPMEQLLQAHRGRTDPKAALRNRQIRREFVARTPQPSSKWERDDHRTRRLNRRLRNSVGDRIFFAPDEFTLSYADQRVLARQASWLINIPSGYKIVVLGHAADPGSLQRNMTLSDQRAHEVRKLLMKHGIATDAIEVRAYGDSRPLALCDSQDCEAQNRRVVLRLSRR